MDKRSLRMLAALILALALASLPSALTEEWEAGVAEAYDASAAPALEAEEGYNEFVEPEIELAQDAGDTGLIIEYEDAGANGLPEEYIADIGLFADDEEEVAPDEGDMTELMALPQVSVGYAAVAPQAAVYADPGLSQVVGIFPEGAPVFVEATEGEGALLRIRFDTEEARSLAQDLPTGYVLAQDALGYTEAETLALTEWLGADASTRYLNGVAVPCVTFGTQEAAAAAGMITVGLDVASHTPEEIQAFVNACPSYRNQLNLYSVAAADEPYVVGRLSPVNQQSALNMINQIRFIAGLNADVSLLYEQEDAMAAASLVIRLNGALSHYPTRPVALADPAYDALYQLGYDGAGHANIAMGYTATSSLLAYMADSDDYNIATVGHRRWIINPQLGRTIMGANGRFSAMYAHDLSGTGMQAKVAWPAQEMPLQYFSATDPWSVSFGRTLDAAQIQVDLVRARDNQAWHFAADRTDGYFNVDNNSYGQRGCVIFRPNSLDGIVDGDVFYVAITDGANNEITNYTVHFFGLDLSAATPFDALTVTAVKTYGGNAVNWNAVPGATGYYVCRRTESSNYQIIADVSDIGYMDVNVFDDLVYYYQVYAHNASVSSRSAVSVQALPVSPDAVFLNYGGTVTTYAPLQLAAGFQPDYAISALKWKSSKKKVATVDANGLVTPLKKGTTIISVETDNGKSASVKVKVVSAPKPKKVILSASGTITLLIGQTVQLAAEVQPADAPSTLRWKTSKASVATVNDGLITAQKEGTATITAKAINGKKAKVKVKVVDPYKPTGVSLNYSGTITLKVGDVLKLDAAVAPETAQTALKWSSSKPKVATVDSLGNVTALRKGTTTIKVKTSNKKKATVKIKVVK